MKTVFLTIYDGDTEKTMLQTGVLRTLKQAGVRIVILVRRNNGPKYAHHASEHIHIEELPRAGCFSERLFYWVGWNMIPTNSIYMRRYESYLKSRSILKYLGGGFLGFLGRFRAFRQLVRLAYGLIPDDYAGELFERYQPDVLFAPNMFGYEDGRLLRTAKRRKVKTVTSTKSWDVLTNKAFTRVIADRILVQNETIKHIAITIGDYPSDHVIVTGFVQFDYVADKSLLMSREDFFKKIGADPSRKLILYSTSGDWKNPYDDEVVQGIHDGLMNGAIREPAQILARFHPKYPSSIEKLDLPHLIKDRPGTGDKKLIGSLDGVTAQVYDFSFTQDDLAHLANSVYHSDVTVNTMSTMTLDAVAYDKPTILIFHDGFDRALPYWKSIRRAYDEDHYQDIIRIRCTKNTHTVRETVAAVDSYLSDPALDATGRAELRDRFLGRLDGKAGERMAEAVLAQLA